MVRTKAKSRSGVVSAVELVVGNSEVSQLRPKIICGTGSPHTVVTAPKGSLYLALDGSSTSTRAFINTDGVKAWTAITTAG